MLTELLVFLLACRASSLLVACQQPVYHGVGVTAYRRCEVGVIVECEAVVSDVVCGIFRLHHGSQCDGLYEFLLFLPVTVGEELVQRFCHGALCPGCLQLIAESYDEVAQCLELCRVRHIVHTVWQHLRLLSLLHLPDTLRDGPVGEEHEFLDELVGFFRDFEVAFHRFPLAVYLEAHLLPVEVHGAVLEPFLTQLLRQRP